MLVSVSVGILDVKSVADALIKAQSVWLRMGMNVYAFVADAVVLPASLPICVLTDRLIGKLWHGKTSSHNRQGRAVSRFVKPIISCRSMHANSEIDRKGRRLRDLFTR